MGIPTGWELVLLLGVLVVLFGSTKLPGAARSIGQSMRIFKAETKGMRADDDAAAGQTAAQQQPQASPQPQPSLPPHQPQTPAGPQAAAPTEGQRNSDTGR
jgi:sec-independent protein translocase protein TatA